MKDWNTIKIRDFIDVELQYFDALGHRSCTIRLTDTPTLDGYAVVGFLAVELPPRFNRKARFLSRVSSLQPWMVGERGFLVLMLLPGL
jgi:hypothetical protein